MYTPDVVYVLPPVTVYDDSSQTVTETELQLTPTLVAAIKFDVEPVNAKLVKTPSLALAE